MCVSVCVLLALVVCTAAEYGQFPRLYHLDDYEWCLAQPRPLYCLGTFRLSPRTQHSPVFDMIQEYSKDQRHFNRTLLHRGYCVSSRCPLPGPVSHVNTTSHFEACVQHKIEPQGLRASLEKLNYCRTREEDVSTMDMPHRVFLIVVGLILVINALGTVCDVIGGEKKSKIWSAWSVQANWKRLMTRHEDGDPRLTALAPIQGARVFLLYLVIMTHASQLQHKVYLYNPSFLERALYHPLSILILNGTSVVQAFIVISNFLFAYSILLYSRTRHISFSALPLFLLHRIIRLTPVQLLVVGFAATWWRQLGSGPQWDPVVGAESEVCRGKFWTHLLYVNNLVDPDNHCLLQTWFLAVDMQLYLVASVVTLVLVRMRQRALHILGFLFIASCIMNAVLAYKYHWKALMHIMTPENVRSTFSGVSSFTNFYVTPWGSLPACLLGLFVGHLHFEIQESGYKIAKHRWLVRVMAWSIPLHVSWVACGLVAREVTSRGATTAFLALERPIFSLLSALCLLGIVNNIDNVHHRCFSWRGFHAMGRLSLSVLMLHWCVNTLLLAARHHLTQASVLTVTTDMASTAVFSYFLAVPLTILVEYPIQRTFAALIS